jgi:hypothetical protein
MSSTRSIKARTGSHDCPARSVAFIAGTGSSHSFRQAMEQDPHNLFFGFIHEYQQVVILALEPERRQSSC